MACTRSYIYNFKFHMIHFSSLITSNSDSGSNENAEIVVNTENEELDLKVLEYIVFVLTDLLNYFAWPNENLGTIL